MHKKDILFLISLPDDIKAGMKISYTEYISILRSIERIELRESISQSDLAMADKFPLVVIVGHNNVSEESLILENGTLLPWTSIISYLPVSCTNTIDIGACKAKLGEKSVAEAIKEHCPNIRRVQSPKRETKVEGRLMLYREMLPSIDHDKDYYDVYCSKVTELKQRVIRLKEGRKSQTETLKGTNLGTMSTSAAPWTVYRNSPFPVKVYIHADGDEIDINVEIDQYQKHRKRKLKLNNGDKISWELCFDTKPMPEYAKYLEHIKGERSYFDTWNSDEPEIRHTFNFFIEEAFPLNGFNGMLKTTIGENKLDEWPFTVNVLPYKDDLSKLKGENLNQEVIKSHANTTNSFIRDIKIGSDEYENMSLYDMQIHIDHKLREPERTGMAGRIRQDYSDLQKEINKKIAERENNKDVIYDDSFLKGQRERLYILDKRMEMLVSLNKIGKMVDGMFDYKVFSKNTRDDVKRESERFFDKINEDFYDTYLKRIYTDEKGEIKFFYTTKEKDDDGEEFSKEILRREYNGLAIMLSKPQMRLDDLHMCLYYEIADKRNNEQKTPCAAFLRSKKRNVGNIIIPYINKIKNDEKLESELDNYLHSKEGYSSVIAYFLREICRSNKK